MADDEEYERLKQEIGWHMTGYDVAFFGVLIAVLWLLVALSM
jgi:nitrogen fixation protein FixH